MRIAYVLTRSDQMSGPQIHLRDLALGLIRRGHEVAVLAGGAGVFADALASHGIPYHALERLVAPIHPLHDPRAVRELAGRLAEIRPDLVSTHSSKAGIIGRLAGRLRGVPTLHTAHGWAFTRRASPLTVQAYVWMERLAARLAERIVTVSEYDRRVALEKRIAPAAKLVCIHNGMPDVDPALRAHPEREPPRLITVGRLEEQKDHPTLLNALHRLRSTAWTLDVVGDGPTRSSLQTLSSRLGLSERVRFLGARGDVARLLAESQVFLLISHWEGFPRSILEAMRAGLPVIATDVAGVGEAVAQDESGFVVPHGDLAAVSDRLARLLEDPPRRAQMGTVGRERYERQFTFERMLGRTLEVYRAVLGERAGEACGTRSPGNDAAPPAASTSTK